MRNIGRCLKTILAILGLTLWLKIQAGHDEAAQKARAAGISDKSLAILQSGASNSLAAKAKGYYIKSREKIQGLGHIQKQVQRDRMGK